MSDVPPGDEPTVEAVSLDEYKALKAAAAAEEAAEPVYVDVRDQKFKVAEELPGIVLLDLGLASDPSATISEQLRALRTFLHSAIHDDDVDRFESYLRTARPVIKIEELNKTTEKLVELTSGRPT